MRRALSISLLMLAPALAACGSKNNSASTPTQTGTQTAPKQGSVGANGCREVQNPAPRNPGRQPKPKSALDASKSWSLVVKTSCGDFTIALDLKAAPHAAASMVALARHGFFKDTTFHRIVPGFVIQGGDPTATGAGGPGYTTIDKPPKGTRYAPGIVAMAKTQAEPVGAAGSQFFVVTGPNVNLPAQYAVLGRVTNGAGAVKRIGRLGSQSEMPTQTVLIYDIAVKSG